ncbi:tRNA-(MS[2]IO[6]A)-hydroxylase [Myxococcus xanthus DK 1622]|uniref:tRNA-(MS[2]IO[6]A)-hydroxylase n=2 Tax=Myxococcus TaxID=32 RepID=Q1DCV0_MYXXD|nr:MULTISPECIES: tRNA-(ms[2]io[6]A)-hydroxylase [Myxococcus]ABF92447.1 tRNA-(MS[2]IO[6]A)-hydroxylase [Myxococcus xanthus DK 1622]NOJ53421.1 tRNA-(ms[2]io[6]A)-hydroxylase [Myxococcus xanthus]QPM80909.1 tRNA-(ms[2]io[6]A)-hydroxylase [Myxococcus xanthus]QQR45684.1 tRNA-(ms[2]io[6]A)-hydroxylase [Myxococcus xanthus]QVW69969.1 tRNA-(ms[2]io[6]A)-hydroxylase [Myxococcus xanthus DZ2]
MSRPTPSRRPLSGEGPVILHAATDPRWLPLALERFDEVLVDHAHCEKKAAANALSMLQAYPDLPGLPSQMARLAREESAHLARVLDLMAARGLTLTKDAGDPYAQGLQKLIRTPAAERRMDRLLVAAVIEARSCERLSLLAEGLTDPALARFYGELAQSEDGHQSLFYRLAVTASEGDETSVKARLEWMLEREAQVITDVGLRAAIH